jgi:hypothetical protein
MEGEPIYLRVGKDIVKHIIEEFPSYKGYVNAEGVMFIQMMKAMYGCVQASLLWYKLLVQVLSEIGFTVSEVDKCVMRLVVGGIVNIILIYVDDLLVFATKEIVDLVLKTHKNRFTWLTVECDEKQFSHLGMQLIWMTDHIIVDMKYYLGQILDNVSGLKRKSVPGGRETFEVSSASDPLGVEKSRWFHAVTAKLLYLAKRARPDILTVISFLCTRVSQPTVEDLDKLMYLLGYLYATRDKVLKISKQPHRLLELYVDAAYGLHDKGESHTGVIILFGRVVVYVASKKQKCIAKSPTEAEVIALSDNIDLISLFHEFAEYICNEELKVPIIYEDCKACIDLVTGAKGQIRTKQIRSRIFRVKSFLDEQKATIVFVRIENMWADGASKPLSQPGKYLSFAHFVLGELTLSQPVGIVNSN